MATPLLELHDVRTWFPVRSGFGFSRSGETVKALDGVSLTVGAGEVVGLVGESGCGKSTLARTVLQLVRPTSGRILLGGTPIDGQASPDWRRRLQMVFQDPYASLNPRFTVFAALAEPFRVHRLCPDAEVPARVAALMESVGLPAALRDRYPHEFSGGQRQRIAIARALGVGPQVLIADEPVSALDVSIQAQILNLLARIVRERRLGLLFIAHDLSVVRHLSDRVAVMHLGRIVEQGPAGEVIGRPQHPYTRALVSAIPVPDPEAARGRGRIVLPGEPPSPLRPPAGCSFHPRCAFARDECRVAAPSLAPGAGGREVACIRAAEIPPAA